MECKHILESNIPFSLWITFAKHGLGLGEEGNGADFSGLQPEGGRINLISSFGEDADGELYLTDHSGAVYRIVAK
jgi:hypothetical protein